MKNKKGLPADWRGFSLIELLIVIALIGILTAIVAVSFSTVQKKTRDSRRMSDMKAIRNGWEQYYGENNQYPATCGSNPGTAYFPSWPLADPKNSDPYVYTSYSCSSSAYCWCAKLESGSGGNATDTQCTMASGSYYCVKQLQ